MTRKECLDAAATCVLQDRQSQYGGMEDNFRIIAGMWSLYLGQPVQAHDVAAMMALLKIARAKSNPGHEDNWVDLAGYAACAAECSGTNSPTPPWAKLAMADAEEVEKAVGKPEFKPGDAVEWGNVGRGWSPAVYLREAGGPGYCIVQKPDGGELIVSRFYLRKAEANHPENPDSSKRAEGCEELVQRIKEVNPAIYGEKKEQD